MRSKSATKVNTGIPYELAVQSIFQEILDQESVRTIRVEHNIDVQGRTTTHQIDILWRFSVGGITYTTIVQAKDWESKIKKDAVLAFRAVLVDIPGQPRGIFVTRSGFQSGAKNLAEKHDIKMYSLKPLLPKYTVTTLGYVRIFLDPNEQIIHATVFDPKVSIRFVPADTPMKEHRLSIPKRFNLTNIYLKSAEGIPIGTVYDILKLKHVVEDMRKTNKLSGSFSREFSDSTYLSPSYRSKKLLRLLAIEGNIEIVPKTQPPVALQSSGIVNFILEDLQSGEHRIYRKKKNHVALLESRQTSR